MSFMVPIAHFERKYLISRDGRVWNQGKKEWKAQTEQPNGYMKVDLKMNGKHEQALVHRLVGLHFIPNPYGHPIVNHKDGIKSHNWEDNLEWTNEVGNSQHALETGLRAGFMSFDEKQMFLDRVLAGEIVGDIASEIGRHPVSLSKMLRIHAERNNQGELWAVTMKQRRKNAALRNLEKINA